MNNPKSAAETISLSESVTNPNLNKNPADHPQKTKHKNGIPIVSKIWIILVSNFSKLPPELLGLINVLFNHLKYFPGVFFRVNAAIFINNSSFFVNHKSPAGGGQFTAQGDFLIINHLDN